MAQNENDSNSSKNRLKGGQSKNTALQEKIDADLAKEAARRAALTPEQRQAEDRRNKVGCSVSVAAVALLFLGLWGCGIIPHNKPAPPVPVETVDTPTWTPEMQAADSARESCIVALNEKMNASPNVPSLDEAMPERLGANDWRWSGIARDLDVTRSFVCTIRDGAATITLK